MSVNELTQTSRPGTRGSVCVMIAGRVGDERLPDCLESVREHSPEGTAVVTVKATTTAVNSALEQVAPADVALLSEPCRVTDGWLGRLRSAANADSNIATASALADSGTALAIAEESRSAEHLRDLADSLAGYTLTLRPRLNRAVGPCVYVRRDALELVGALDEELDLRWALEIDLAQRCLLSGLAHVAADDVLIGHLPSPAGSGGLVLPAVLRERYPYLSQPLQTAASNVLARALEAVRQPRSQLWVTIDARALDGAVTGTQVHILELIRALAQTGALRLRLLVRATRIDRAALALLRHLPETELLAEDEVDEETPKSTIVHRPQQMFAPEDVELALALGERLVLSQLDLIAYRNPGYFADARAWEAYRRASRHGMSAAERVVVFSDHTRRELLADGLVEDERIRIVPPGLDHRSGAEPRAPAALDDGLSDFLLCLGTDFRHKNRVFALRLLAALSERHGWQGSLVLAGTHIPYGSSLELEQVLLEQHPRLRDRVVQLGSVSEQEKAWLIEHAGAVLYPSVYEGFGLVPFESALYGVPCVFAAHSSIGEATPPGTATIVPWNPVESAAAAHTLLTEPKARSEHVGALAAAAHELTWASTARAIVEVYREAALAPVRAAGTLGRDAVERERELTVAHESVVQRLIGEREHAQGMYDELNAEVGSGLSLIGPHGTLPDDLQRALLALSARPAWSRPLYGAVSRAFRAARVAARAIPSLRHGPR